LRRAQKELNETDDVTYWDVASYDAARLVADALKHGGRQAADYVKAMAATKICWDTMSLTKSAVRNPTDWTSYSSAPNWTAASKSFNKMFAQIWRHLGRAERCSRA
jgi:hypothetical protein